MKKCRKIFSVILMCILCLSNIQVQASDVIKSVADSTRAIENTTFCSGDWVSVTQMPRLSNGLGGYFYVEGAISWGFCAENGKDFWSNNVAKSGYITEWDNPIIRKILYYAPGSPGYTGTDIAYDMDNATFATGYINGMCTNNTRAKAHIAYLETLQDPIIWGYKAYKIDITPDNYQDVAFLGYGAKGYLEIVKYSANMDATEGNENYSLAGAVYGVYAADGEYSSPEYTITISAWKDGWSGLPVGAEYGWGRIELPPGDYWVKELTAPQGYELDPNWYPSYSTPVTVTSRATVRVNVADEPQMPLIDILLSKVNEGGELPSLANAHFKVTYYGILLDDANKDPATLGEEALQGVNIRSWVFKTDESGLSHFQDEFLVSGDNLYYNSDGIPSLPIGTITIKEEKAPEGYLKNNEVFVRQITAEGNAETADIYHYPIISEVTMDLDVFKKQEGTEIAIPGAVFEHTKPDGTAETLTTDKNGKLSFKALKHGIHELREVSAPEGYVVNENVIRFCVAEDNTVTYTSESDETILLGVSDVGNVEVTVYEKVAPFCLLLHKQNENGVKLEGAEFTLYADEMCTQVIQTGVTSAEGIFKFENLTVGTRYYLKETKAPAGYKLPLDETGNEIVTNLYVTSVPVLNEFKLYVNGSEYDFASQGAFSLTGTKSTQEINMTVINKMGYLLPQTGSYTTLFLMMWGVFLFMLGISCFTKTERNKKGDKNFMRKRFEKRIMTLLLAAVLTVISMIGGTTVNAALLNVEHGVVDFGRGEAQITINGNEGQSLVGKTFQVYRLFDAENSKGLESVNYIFNPEFKEALQTVVGKKLNKEIEEVTEYEAIDYIQSLNSNEVEGARAVQVNEAHSSEFRYFIEELREEIEKSGKTGDALTVASVRADNSVTIEGLEYGYYIVDEVTSVSGTNQAASLCIVNTANANAYVNIKSDYPTVIKKIQEDDNHVGWNDIGDYEIGQTVPYKFTSNVPNMNGYDTYYYAWHDVMDEALTFKKESVCIKIVDDTVDTTYVLEDTEYKIAENTESGDSFVIEIEDLKAIVDREFNEKYGQKVIVNYEATLNDKAAKNTGRGGFENDVRLEFSNNPDSDGTGQTGFTPWDTVVCFTYQLDVLKTNNHDLRLEGAKFRLYSDEACTEEVYVKKTEDGYNIVNRGSIDETQSIDVVEMVSDKNGSIIINGLDSDTYYLKETQAPIGYRKLNNPIVLTVASSFTTERDSYVKGDGTTDKTLVNLIATAHIKTFLNGLLSQEETTLVTDAETGKINITVINAVGKKLPVTGSVATVVMLVLGTGLVMFYLFGKKKNEDKKHR